MSKVLDLDLDFFVWPIHRDCEETDGRLAASEYRSQSEEEVREFLELKCGLSIDRPIIGRRIVHHVEAFAAWRDWKSSGTLTTPFTIVHADAHSDLGSGWMNQSPRFFETELLAMPLADRSAPRLGIDAMNSGNYLVGAIANQWVERLTYVFPKDPSPPLLTGTMALAETLRQLRFGAGREEIHVGDLPAYVFHDGDPELGIIELKTYSAEGYHGPRDPEPLEHHPQIPFEAIPACKFTGGEFTHMIVAQSPAYTPEEADHLLPIIEEYFVTA